MNRDEIFQLIARAAGYDPEGYIGVEELDAINDAVNVINVSEREFRSEILGWFAR